MSDRHERRKDREYREDAEREKLAFENRMRELKVINEEIELADKLGLPREELAPFRSHLLHKPLERLGSIQDRGTIGSAELIDAHDPTER